MEVAEWIVWGLGFIWLGFIFFIFLMAFFKPDPHAQPMDAELFPYSLDSYLSINEKRIISTLYLMGMIVALSVTIILDISKLHLLWFIPAFHMFGTQWSIRLFRRVHKKTFDIERADKKIRFAFTDEMKSGNTLKACIEKIRTFDVYSFDKTQARKAIIEPILENLGWDFYNPSEVKLEYTTSTGGRVDYAFFYNDNLKILLEAKKPGESLDKHAEQLFRYASEEGSPLAVLTNGLDWRLYLPFSIGMPKDDSVFRLLIRRRLDLYASIEIQAQELDDICNNFTNFLSKDNVLSFKSRLELEIMAAQRRAQEHYGAAAKKLAPQLLKQRDKICKSVCKTYLGVKPIQNKDENVGELKIREVIAKKYGINITPSVDSPVLTMNLNLTVSELIKQQEEMKKESIDIGVNLARSVDILTRMRKLSSATMLLDIWHVYLIVSIILFFISKILSVLFIVFTIFALLYTKVLYRKIRKLVLTDYEAFYVLLGTNGIRMRRIRRED